jgi:hypothetical protein
MLRAAYYHEAGREAASSRRSDDTTGGCLTTEPMEPEKHASDDQLQWYVCDRLTVAQTKDLETHLLQCNECVRRLTDTIGFFRDFSMQKPQDASAGERRHEPRFSTKGSAKIQSLNPFSPNWSTVSLVDVSKGGLRLESNERLGVGTLIRVRLNSTIIFGDVRHCNPSGQKFDVGIQVQDVFCGSPR